MKKSQTITLVILFIAVSLFIWVGACSDKEPPKEYSTSKINSSNIPTKEPAPTNAPSNTVKKPEVDFGSLDGLGTWPLAPEISTESKNFYAEDTKEALKDKEYITTLPGTSTNDIYMSFMLESSANNKYVIQILDLAKEKGAKFTFAMTSSYINNSSNADVIKRIYEEGHTLATRGDLSVDIENVSAEAFYNSLWEMETKLQQILEKGVRMDFYMPDDFSERNIEIANQMGYTVVFKYTGFANAEPSKDETFNGILYQSSNLTDKLITELTNYVDWAMNEAGYTLKGFAK